MALYIIAGGLAPEIAAAVCKYKADKQNSIVFLTAFKIALENNAVINQVFHKPLWGCFHCKGTNTADNNIWPHQQQLFELWKWNLPLSNLRKGKERSHYPNINLKINLFKAWCHKGKLDQTFLVVKKMEKVFTKILFDDWSDCTNLASHLWPSLMFICLPPNNLSTHNIS